ncbi:MAG: serine/threonine protein kinase [Myxococcales bacterium]|nr:serine/threonine protein kinase [Myxococcales bacterium]
MSKVPTPIAPAPGREPDRSEPVEATTVLVKPPPPPPIDITRPTGPGSSTATAPMPRVDPMLGKVLNGRYKVTELIAKGGMGSVYKALQSPLDRVVALKVLDGSSEEDQDKEFRGRFILEAAATAKLTHPNTIRIFDYGQTSDQIFYIAMEYLDGRTLHQALREDGVFTPERLIHILCQVCSSLREAHALGLIHRDLKPANVVLLRTGEEAEFAKVLDFGLVKEVSGKGDLTRTDAVVGSPSYMSPEQIRSTNVDNRSDIYALGVLMYTCLVGKPPFTGTSPVNLLMAHLHHAPPPITERARMERAPMLAWIVMTCLKKEPDDRFASVDELSRALRVAAAELRGETPGHPSLLNGRLVIEGEPTPSGASPRLQPGLSGAPAGRPAGVIARSTAPSRGQRAPTRPAAPGPRIPPWVPVVGVVVLLGAMVLLGLAVGGMWFGGAFGAPGDH